MKLMKKIGILLLTVLMAVGLCVPVSASDVKKIQLTKGRMEMSVGETRPLSVKFSPRGEKDEVTWKSNRDNVASVDSDGNVTALEKGNATITATTGDGLTATCYITVERAGKEVQVKGVEIAVDSLTVRVNQTRTLWAMVTPNNAKDQDVMWSSSDNNVATIDEEGTVTAIAPGTAIITATSHNGSAGTCTVTVSNKVVTGLTEDVENTQKPGPGELLTSAAVKTVVEQTARTTTKGQVGTAVFENKTAISSTMLQAATYTAGLNDRTVHLRFNTLNSDGKIQGWLTLDPAKADSVTADVGTLVSLSSKTAQSVSKSFQDHYKNRTAVIHNNNAGAFGLEVQIAARLGKDWANNKNLRFYVYNAKDSRYNSLAVTSYTVDENGLLRFSTTTGGVIVVSDGALVKR